LADQLTPEQIAEIEYCEREETPPGIANPGNHLNHARKLAELNVARAVLADIAPPADAVGEADDWMDWDDAVYQRMFTSWTHSACEVSIVGWQFSDGRVERDILDSGGDGSMTAAQAPARAAALLEAADELDRL
jgi:hypothetical protein